MMEINLSYDSQIDFDGGADSTGLPLHVKGLSCKAGYIKSKHFIIPDNELENIAATLKKGIDGHGAYILKDHGFEGGPWVKTVDKLVGRITDAEKKGRVVNYEGRIEDADMAAKIRNKLITSSSVGLKVNKMFCSICGREYGDDDCTHRLGKEYKSEGLHKIAKKYLKEMGGKPIAAIVGAEMEGREQAIVLFPAIPGSSVGLNFSEELEKFIDDAEELKIETLETKTVENSMEESEIIAKLEQISEAFNRDFSQEYSEQTMSEDFDLEKVTEEMTDLKVANKLLSDEKATLDERTVELQGEVDSLTTERDDLSSKLETAKEVVETYKKADEQRLAEEKATLVEELTELRKELEFSEKDYSEASHDVIMDALDTLKSLPTTGGGQARPGDDNPDELKVELKEDVREVIFGKRKDGKPLKGLRKIMVE